MAETTTLFGSLTQSVLPTHPPLPLRQRAQMIAATLSLAPKKTVSPHESSDSEPDDELDSSVADETHVPVTSISLQVPVPRPCPDEVLSHPALSNWTPFAGGRYQLIRSRQVWQLNIVSTQSDCALDIRCRPCRSATKLSLPKSQLPLTTDAQLVDSVLVQYSGINAFHVHAAARDDPGLLPRGVSLDPVSCVVVVLGGDLESISLSRKRKRSESSELDVSMHEA